MSDRLDELGAELPWDRPDDGRRAAVRSSLLTAAAETSRRRSIGRWFVVGGAFACGAAAAVLAVTLWPRTAPDDHQLAQVEASPAAHLEDTVTRTATGSDETVRVHGGKVRLAVGELRRGDRVRVATGDAVVEGVGSYEVSVANDALSEVTVQIGTAEVRISGHQAVFLAAGQTWRASVVTADLEPAAPGTPTPPSDVAATTATGSPTAVPPATPTTTVSTTTSSSPRDGVATTSLSSPVITSSSKRDGAAATSSTSSITSSSNRDGVAATASPTSPPTSPSTTAPTSSSTTPPSTSSTAVSRADKRDGSATKSSTTVPLDEPPATTSPTQISVGSASPTSPGRAKSVTEQHLQAGWALLRAGKPAEAAAELGKAADGDGDLAADARYFQSVALIRAGRSADAERTLVGFLDHAPKSIRRGRASVMLARLLAARGDSKSARAWFDAALQDHDPSVVAAARDGIAALH